MKVAAVAQRGWDRLLGVGDRSAVVVSGRSVVVVHGSGSPKGWWSVMAARVVAVRSAAGARGGGPGRSRSFGPRPAGRQLQVAPPWGVGEPTRVG